MSNSLGRKATVAAVLSVAMLGFAAPAFADTAHGDASPNGGVVVVDQPDTSNLNNLWTFAPLGVPVFGLIQSVAQAGGKIY